MTHDNGEFDSAEVPGNGFLELEFIGSADTYMDRPLGIKDHRSFWRCRVCGIVYNRALYCAICKPRSAETGQAKAETEKHTLDQAIEDANAWARATFPTETTAGVVNHLRREVEELAKHPTDWAEMADVLILLARLADRAGVNLREAVESKLSLLRTREWGEPDADGVVEHVR